MSTSTSLLADSMSSPSIHPGQSAQRGPERSTSSHSHTAEVREFEQAEHEMLLGNDHESIVTSRDESLRAEGIITEKQPNSAHSAIPLWLVLYGRLGGYLVFVFCASTVVILAASGFLTMLWWSNTSNSTWHNIVVRDWLTRAVSLTTLALRIAVSLQAAIATSMLAAIALERGINFGDAAAVSVARFANTGPYAFPLTFLRQSKMLAPTALLLALICTTLASQFSSTLLLSDLSAQMVPARLVGNSTAYGFLYPPTNTTTTSRPEDFMLSLSTQWRPNYWAQGPTAFPAFAEYTSPTAAVPNTANSSLDDTGIMIRSFLPFSTPAARETLRDFNGELLTFDSRVVCVRPDFTNFRIENSTLVGSVKPSVQVPGLIFNDTGVAFSCLPSPVTRGPMNMVDLSDPIPGNVRDTTWTVCKLGAEAGGLISMLDPTNNESLRHQWSDDERRPSWMAVLGNSTWPVDLGNAYLVLNYSFGSDEGFDIKQGWNIQGDGPWIDAHHPIASDWETHIRVSLCYDALTLDSSYNHIQEYNVSITATGVRTEPRLTWMNQSNSFDTTQVRKQLGAMRNRLNPQDRGILRLDGETLLRDIRSLSQKWTPSWGDYDGDFDDHDYNWFHKATYPWLIRQVLSYPSLNAPFCFLCANKVGKTTAAKNDSVTQTSVNVVQTALFNDIIGNTDSPALALQAQLTTLLRMAYYDWLPQFNANSGFSSLSFQSSLVPSGHKGYYSVMSIIILHFFIIAMISLSFFMQTKHSLLDNAWQTILQVAQSPRTAEVLSTMDTDKLDHEVRQALNGKDKIKCRLGVADGNGAITLIPVSTEKMDGLESA